MNKNLLKVTIGLSLFSALLAVDSKIVEADNPANVSNVQTYAENSLDISTGWTKAEFSSNLANIYPEDIFKQNVTSSDKKQKMILNNFANIGNATLSYKKTIPMKKGHTYKLNLIYAMQFSKGSGYIDFNGEKIDSDSVSNDAKDHSYTKEVTPIADMNYTIVISYKVPTRAVGYLKLGYDTANGNGITDTSAIVAPVLNAPFAGQNKITGTGVKGNTIDINDSEGNLLGHGTIDTNGNFEVTVNRPFNANEKITGIQIDSNGVKSEEGSVTVKELAIPTVPHLTNPLTEESTVVAGTADPNAQIEVIIGDEKYETTTDADGNFSLNLDHKFPVETVVEITATDDKGTKSPVLTDKVHYDKDILLEFDYVLSTEDNQLTGTSTRPNTEVTISVGSRVFTTTTDDQGNFVLDLPTLYQAGTAVKGKITDKAGKTATADQIILPRTPSMPNIQSGLTNISGIADAGAKVHLVVNHCGKNYSYDADANSNGEYSIDLKDEGGVVFSLTLGDKVTINSTLTVGTQELKSETTSKAVMTRMF